MRHLAVLLAVFQKVQKFRLALGGLLVGFVFERQLGKNEPRHTNTAPIFLSYLRSSTLLRSMITGCGVYQKSELPSSLKCVLCLD